MEARLIYPSTADQSRRMLEVAAFASYRTRHKASYSVLNSRVRSMATQELVAYLAKVSQVDFAYDVLEMIALVYDWEGVPLWLIVEMLRHRLVWRDFSLEQLSQRAISGMRLELSGENEDANALAREYMRKLEVVLKSGRLANEDLREYVPQGVLVNCVIAANARAWQHFFFMRCSKEKGGHGGAHPKFEALADEMLLQAIDRFGDLFAAIPRV